MTALWTVIVIYGGGQVNEPYRIVAMVSKATQVECESLARDQNKKANRGYTAYCAYVPGEKR